MHSLSYVMHNQGHVMHTQGHVMHNQGHVMHSLSYVMHNQGHVMHSLSFVMHNQSHVLKPNVCLLKIPDFDKKSENVAMHNAYSELSDRFKEINIQYLQFIGPLCILFVC